MPKSTSKNPPDALTPLLTSLQRQLRSSIKKTPPLFVVEIKNDFSQDPDFLRILMIGIAGPNRAYIRLGQGPEIGDIIAFADDPSAVAKGIVALREVTPAIFKLIDILRNGRTGSSMEMSIDHQLTMVGPLICTLVEVAKKNYPRGSLPKVIAGPIAYNAEGRGNLEFPTGNHVDRELDHAELWQRIHTDFNPSQPTIRLIEIPPLQAASSVVKAMLDSIRTGKQAKPSKLFRTRHDESKGQWSGVFSLTRIAATMNQSTATAKKNLAKTGLIQKSSRSWIARIDNLKPPWAKAFRDLPENKVIVGKKASE